MDCPGGRMGRRRGLKILKGGSLEYVTPCYFKFSSLERIDR